MSHIRLEQLVLAIGGATILGSLAVSLPTGSQPELIEIVAQLMLLAVLFAAVRYGRRGGVVAACLAAILYVALRIPTFGDSPPTSAMALIIATRIAAFGLIGIVGAEASRHILYSIARLEGGSALDEWSRVFNQRYFAREFEQALGRSTRYGEPFGLVVIAISPSLFGDLRPTRQRTLVRSLGDALRSDIRLVDEVARLDDGRFAVLLPHTSKPGTDVVGARLTTLTRKSLAARDEAVSSRCLSAPEDEPQMRALLAEISRAEAVQTASAE